MKNYWSILPDNCSFLYEFVLKKGEYNIELIKELLNLIVLSGWEFGIVKVLDQESGKNYCDEFLNLFSVILDEKKDVSELRDNYTFFSQAFPYLDESNKNPHVIVTELAFYSENGEVVLKDVFSNKIFYPLLNPHRIHLYHYLETGSVSPIFLELYIPNNRELRLTISSGLGIWQPYYKPDYDMDKQTLEDFPLNGYGYIDNRELYMLNTPRLLAFVKKVRTFFKIKNGLELFYNNSLV